MLCEWLYSLLIVILEATANIFGDGVAADLGDLLINGFYGDFLGCPVP